MWSRQLPFLVLLVFGIGVGLGAAWKEGWIPVEFGRPNMGRLETSQTVDLNPEFESSSSEIDIPSPNHVQREDASISELQSEPEAAVEAPRRQAELSKVIPAQHNEPQQPPARLKDQDPDWARGAAEEPQHARHVSVKQPQPTTRPREIVQVKNQDPTENSADDVRAQPPISPLVETLKAIDEQIANEEFLPAHRALSKLYWNHKEARDDLLPRLQQTARVIFFEPRPHLVDPYIVQPNDQMRVIAGKYQLTWEYLSKLNRTEPRRLQPGQKLKVLKGPFAAVVDLSEFALTIHLQGYFVKRYEVGIGKDGASPVGKFPVLNKVDNPQYTGPDGKVIGADDPANPLGERWIDLGESYGIHGTIEPDSIGKAASRGCIRMRSKDVIEVYDFLVKGSEVSIRK